MRITFTILLVHLIGLTPILSQQRKIDSLQAEIIRLEERPSIEYLDALFELGLIITDNSFPDDNSKANKLLEHSEKLNYKEGIVNSHLLSGIVARKNFDQQKARAKLNLALQKSYELPNYKRSARLYVELARLYADMGLSDTSQSYFKKAKEQSISSGDQTSLGIAKMYTGDLQGAVEIFSAINEPIYLAVSIWQDGMGHKSNGDFGKALESCFHSIRILEEENSSVVLALVQLNVGRIYMDLYDLDLANSFFKKAAENFENHGIRGYNYGAILDNLAYLSRINKNYEQAMDYRRKSNKIWEEISSQVDIDRGKVSLALIHQEGFGRIDKAIELMKESIASQKKRGDQYNLRISYLHLGSFYCMSNDFENAIETLSEGWKVNQQLGLSDNFSTDYLLWMARANNGLSQFKEAYENMSNYINLDDSLFNHKKSVEIGKIESQHKIEQQQKEKELLKVKATLHESQLKRQRTIIIAVATLAILLLIGSIYFYRAFVQRKRLSHQLVEKNREINELYSSQSAWFTNIAHEIKTPLTLILGPLDQMSSEMNREGDVSTSTQLLRMARKNTNSLLGLVNKILDFSKLNEQLLVLDQNPTDLVKLLSNTIAMYDSTLKDKRLHLYTSFPESLVLNIDHEKVEQIITNLLSNAIKYTNPGGTINVELKFPSEDENMIRLSVKDTGIGISSMHIKNVFNRHFRIKTNEQIGGSGIGLAFSQELAKTHGGLLSVSSTLGKGSEFTLSLPASLMWTIEGLEIKDEVFDGDTYALEEPIDIEPINDDISILLVEDNADMRSFVSSIFSSTYKLSTAIDGQDALDKLEKFETSELPNLIISDMMMPRIGGEELINRLKKNDKYKDIQIIVLTARSRVEEKISTLKLGVDDYIIKPFKASELQARVNNIIENSRIRKQLLEEAPAEMITDKPISYQENLVKELEAKAKKSLKELEKGGTYFTVSDLAEQANMEQRTLYRLLVRTCGLTPLKFLREIRLQEAYELIIKGEYATIQEVAFKVGFEKPSHFSKLFIERYGLKPSHLNKNSC